MFIKVFQWIIVIIKALIIHVAGRLIIVSIDKNEFGLKLFIEIQKLQGKKTPEITGVYVICNTKRKYYFKSNIFLTSTLPLLSIL